METSAIRYRVVDFLKEHPPFQAMDDEDLLVLAERGRVRFHEVDEYVYWQGTPHGPHLFVIQQGTVSLWDEAEGTPRLQDVRGPGDLLGVDRFLGSDLHVHSAKAASDVMLYAFEASAFEPLLAKYPNAARYVAAHFSVSAYDEPRDPHRRPEQAFAYDRMRDRKPLRCSPHDPVQAAARLLADSGGFAVSVVGEGGRLVGVVTAERLVRFVAEGGQSQAPVSGMMEPPPPAAPPDVRVDRVVFGMAESGRNVVAITTGGAPEDPVLALITGRDLSPLFGESPIRFLAEADHASSVAALRNLNVRARSFLLEQLASPSSTDWLTRFAWHFDRRLVGRVLALIDAPRDSTCWFFLGATGRGESMMPLLPQVGLVYDPDSPAAEFFPDWYERAMVGLHECGYVRQEGAGAPDLPFRCASLPEWKERFRGWIRDPVRNRLYRARPLFDLQAVSGRTEWLGEIESVIREEVAAGGPFLKLLAHDCLSHLPPLSFYRDLVVEESGEQTAVFQLERSALRPLVDVGRVFGIAAGHVLGGSTLDRYQWAREREHAHDPIFRDAAETVRVLLYHQARAGIRGHGGGADLEPSALSRHDRQVLKAGFRSILRLLEFTVESRWLQG